MVRNLVFILLLAPAIAYATDCTRLTVSSNTEYPPYLWVSNTNAMQLEGSFVTLMQQLSQASGIELQVIYAGPWARTQAQAHSGKLDLLGAFHTHSRAEWLDYLYPALLPTSIAIWVNRHKTFDFNQLSDLAGRSGLTVTSNSLGQAFDAYAKTTLTISEVSSVEQGLLMLEEQRADYLVYERVPGQIYNSQLNTHDVIPLPTPVSSELIYLSMSKKSDCNTKKVKQKLSMALVLHLEFLLKAK